MGGSDFPLVFRKVQATPPRGGEGSALLGGWVCGVVVWRPSSELQLKGLHSLQVSFCLQAGMAVDQAL